MLTMPNREEQRFDLSAKLRSLPSVDQVLTAPPMVGALAQWDRPLVVEAVRATIAEARARLRSGSHAASGASEIAALEQKRL